MNLFKKREPKKYQLPIGGHLRWISVEEALPMMFNKVLVYGKYYDKKEGEVVLQQEYMQCIVADRWTGWNGDHNSTEFGKDRWVWRGMNDRSLEKVTHWYPIPSDDPYFL